MKLSVWAELQGHQLPVSAHQLPTRTGVVDAQRPVDGVALYARVCSADQKGDLDRQLARLTGYAAANKMMIVDAAAGSGLNGRRKERSARNRAQKALDAIDE